MKSLLTSLRPLIRKMRKRRGIFQRYELSSDEDQEDDQSASTVAATIPTESIRHVSYEFGDHVSQKTSFFNLPRSPKRARTTPVLTPTGVNSPAEPADDDAPEDLELEYLLHRLESLDTAFDPAPPPRKRTAGVRIYLSRRLAFMPTVAAPGPTNPALDAAR